MSYPNVPIGINTPVYITDGSKVCPHCQGQDVHSVGQVWLDGNPRDIDKCNNCGASFSQDTKGVQHFIEQAESATSSSHVTVTLTSGTTTSGIHTSGTSGSTSNIITDSTSTVGTLETTLDYDSKNKLDQMNSNINNMTSQIHNLNMNIQELVSQIMDLTVQNQKLQEKVFNDPLKGLKNNVFDFNLE